MIESSTKKIENMEGKKHASEFIGIIKWAEFAMNNVLTEENVEMYLGYLKWVEKLAKKFDYDLRIRVYDEYVQCQ